MQNKNIYAYIGFKIKEAREAAGKTQEELAEHLSLTRTSVTNFESGRQRIKIDTLYQITEYFNKSIEYFLPKNSNPIMVHRARRRMIRKSKEGVVKRFSKWVCGDRG